MVLNQDFREFIEQLNDKKVKYLVVGGYAVAYHGYPRYTKDIDFWIWLDDENASNMILALKGFGFLSSEIKKEDFLDKDMVVQLGYPPNRIDLITDVSGVDFETCYENKVQVDIEGLLVNFIDLNSLIKNPLVGPKIWLMQKTWRQAMKEVTPNISYLSTQA
ncbi:MAG: hypothetical protein AAFO96_29345 [Bacteroidota bacterium]